MMKFLVDGVFPEIQNAEATAGIDFISWDGSDQPDTHIVRHASDNGFQGIVFCDQRPLAQPHLCELAEELCITLVAVVASDPVEAKQRLLRNAERLRKLLSNDAPNFVRVFADRVRPFRPPN